MLRSPFPLPDAAGVASELKFPWSLEQHESDGAPGRHARNTTATCAQYVAGSPRMYAAVEATLMLSGSGFQPGHTCAGGGSGVRGGDASPRIDSRWSNKNRPAMEPVVQDAQSYDMASRDHGFY